MLSGRSVVPKVGLGYSAVCLIPSVSWLFAAGGSGLPHRWEGVVTERLSGEFNTHTCLGLCV